MKVALKLLLASVIELETDHVKHFFYGDLFVCLFATFCTIIHSHFC